MGRKKKVEEEEDLESPLEDPEQFESEIHPDDPEESPQEEEAYDDRDELEGLFPSEEEE